MKKIIIFVLVCCAIAGGPEVAIMIASLGFIWLIARILGKLGLLSAPRKISNAAGNEVRKAYNRRVLRDLFRR